MPLQLREEMQGRRLVPLFDRGSHQDVVERPEEEMQRHTVAHFGQRTCD